MMHFKLAFYIEEKYEGKGLVACFCLVNNNIGLTKAESRALGNLISHVDCDDYEHGYPREMFEDIPELAPEDMYRDFVEIAQKLGHTVEINRAIFDPWVVDEFNDDDLDRPAKESWEKQQTGDMIVFSRR